MESNSSFIPDAILYRYFLLLNPPVGRNGTQVKPTKEDLDKIKLWLEKEFKNFPHAPEIFFQENYQIKEGKSTSIDTFFKIKYELQRLMNYKILINETLNGLREEFESIIVDKSPYNIDPNSPRNALPGFVVQNSNVTLNKLFFMTNGRFAYFPDFINYGFRANGNNLFNLSNGSNKNPFFYQVFINNYKGDKLDFLKKIFKEYIQIRNGLIKRINDYYGLLAFEPIFDITKKSSLQIVKNRKSPNNIKRTFEPNPLYNSIRANLNQTNHNSSYNAFMESIGEPLNSASTPNKTRFNEKTANQLEKAYQFMQLKPTEDLYGQIGEENIFEFELKQKLTNIFENMCKNLKKIYYMENMNLLQIIESHLEIDSSTIEFIFNFVRPDLFLNALKIKSKIYKFIQKNIDLYQNYIEDFDIWIYNYLLGYKIDPMNVGDSEFKKVYESFYQFITQIFEKTKKERAENKAVKLDEKGIFVNVSVPESSSSPENDEFKRLLGEL